MRLALIGASVLLCYTLSPFGFHGLPAAGLGFFMAMVILLAELRLRRAEISGLMGGAIGAVLGLLGALLITLVVSRTAEPEPTKSFFEFTSLFALGYLGLVIGSRKGPEFSQSRERLKEAPGDVDALGSWLVRRRVSVEIASPTHCSPGWVRMRSRRRTSTFWGLNLIAVDASKKPTVFGRRRWL